MDGLARILLVRGGGGDLGEDDDRGASFNGLSAVVTTTFSIGLAGIIVEKDLRFATSAAAARAPVDPPPVCRAGGEEDRPLFLAGDAPAAAIMPRRRGRPPLCRSGEGDGNGLADRPRRE